MAFQPLPYWQISHFRRIRILYQRQRKQRFHQKYDYVNFEGQKVYSYAYEFNCFMQGLEEILGGDFMGINFLFLFCNSKS